MTCKRHNIFRVVAERRNADDHLDPPTEVLPRRVSFRLLDQRPQPRPTENQTAIEMQLCAFVAQACVVVRRGHRPPQLRLDLRCSTQIQVRTKLIQKKSAAAAYLEQAQVGGVASGVRPSYGTENCGFNQSQWPALQVLLPVLTAPPRRDPMQTLSRSEEHTSEL